MAVGEGRERGEGCLVGVGVFSKPAVWGAWAGGCQVCLRDCFQTDKPPCFSQLLISHPLHPHIMLFFIQSFPLFLIVKVFFFFFFLVSHFQPRLSLKQHQIHCFIYFTLPRFFFLTHSHTNTHTRQDGITVLLKNDEHMVTPHTGWVPFLGLSILHYKRSTRILNLFYCTLSKGKTIHNSLKVDEYIYQIH